MARTHRAAMAQFSPLDECLAAAITNERRPLYLNRSALELGLRLASALPKRVGHRPLYGRSGLREMSSALAFISERLAP